MAIERISINKLSAMLKKLNFTYPYHQAIGFYLEKAGVYSESQIKIIEKFQRKYDFYLTHQNTLKNGNYFIQRVSNFENFLTT